MNEDILSQFSENEIAEAIAFARTFTDVQEAKSALKKMELIGEHVLAILVRNYERRSWIEKWPHFCRKCEGTGREYTPGDRETPDQIDPCSFCTDQGICARCGTTGLREQDGEIADFCSHCGWKYDDSLPPPYEWM